MDGDVSNPTTKVVTGSTVYPEGTTEQYPNAGRNEGHYYMECSNKGVCNRKTGQCECFAGYTGTACVRADCPNDCSGHGTCESIRELAEMAVYNTNKKHVDSSSEPTYGYSLWDQDKTMGCKCDPGYWGADCSLRKCKYGVDPLFYDDRPEPTYQKTVIRIGALHAGATKPTGTFKISFYDVFGEEYVTRPIAADAAATAVQNALQALPNGVIQTTAQLQAQATDVDQTAVTSVTVVKGANDNGATHAGPFMDADKDNDADGFTYTITFKNNPGILKTLELHTAGLSAGGTLYTRVSNQQKGEYVSRYAQSIGRIQSAVYGSKTVHFTTLHSLASANSLVKIGNQEMIITGVDTNAKSITFADVYVGSTIEPFLTETGLFATDYATTSVTTNSAFTAADKTQIYIKNAAGTYRCPLTCNGAASTTTVTVHETVVTYQTDPNTCTALASGGTTYPLYLRSEKFANQNAYVTATLINGVTTAGDVYGDLTSTANSGYYLTPGSTQVHTFVRNAITGATVSSNVITPSADATGSFGTAATKKYIYANGAAFEVTGATNAPDITVAASNVEGQYLTGNILQAAGTETNILYGVQAHGVSAGDRLLISGRRYTVASVSASAGDGMFQLDEPYHGRRHHESGPLVKICDACVTEVATAAAGLTITVDANKVPAIAKGEVLYRHTYLNEGDALFVMDDVAADATSIKAARGTSTQSGTAANSLTQPLYRKDEHALDGVMYEIFKITEASINGYEYVTQCSNRGACDDSSGVCGCFKGYSNDNCDTQNMLAA